MDTRRRAHLVLVLLCLLPLSCAAVDGGRKPRVLPRLYTGEFTIWWSDTVVKEKGSYENSLRNGFVETFSPDGTLATAGEYQRGVPVGEIRTFYPDGTLALSEVFVDGALQGLRVAYWPDGSQRFVNTYVDNLKNGPEQEWSEGGVILKNGQWRGGFPSGRWEYFDPAGRLMRVEHYWIKDGAPSGYLETAYDGSGRPTVQTLRVFEDGTWKGWMTLWHDNGRQAGLVEIVDGLREGRDISWDTGGRKTSEGLRVDDERVGPWNFYEDGQLVRTVDYVVEETVEESASG